jgi:hypothetical protein
MKSASVGVVECALLCARVCVCVCVTVCVCVCEGAMLNSYL